MLFPALTFAEGLSQPRAKDPGRGQVPLVSHASGLHKRMGKTWQLESPAVPPPFPD